LAITFEPETLDGLSKALKTHSLVSNKNLSQKNGSCSLDPGPDDLSQKCLNHPTYDTTHKNLRTKTFKFFINPN